MIPNNLLCIDIPRTVIFNPRHLQDAVLEQQRRLMHTFQHNAPWLSDSSTSWHKSADIYIRTSKLVKWITCSVGPSCLTHCFTPSQRVWGQYDVIPNNLLCIDIPLKVILVRQRLSNIIVGLPCGACLQGMYVLGIGSDAACMRHQHYSITNPLLFIVR